MTPKELVSYMIVSFSLEKIDWAIQVRHAKDLLTKYTWIQLKYAIDYYKKLGTPLYSLGYLKVKNNMKDPLSMCKAEESIVEDNNSGKRNWDRIRNYSKT